MRDIKRAKRKKANHPTGSEPMTSGSQGVSSTAVLQPLPLKSQRLITGLKWMLFTKKLFRHGCQQPGTKINYLCYNKICIFLCSGEIYNKINAFKCHCVIPCDVSIHSRVKSVIASSDKFGDLETLPAPKYWQSSRSFNSFRKSNLNELAQVVTIGTRTD